MGEAERRAGDAAAHAPAFLVLAPGLLETAQRFERARQVRVRAVEAGIELDRLAVVDERALVFAGVVVRIPDARVDQHRQRVEAERPQHRLLRFAVTFGAVIEAPEGDVRSGRSGVHIDRTLQVADGSLQIHLPHRDRPQRGVGLSHGIVQLQRLHRGRAGLRVRFGRGSHSAAGARDVTVRDPGPGGGMLGVELERALKVPQAQLDGLWGGGGGGMSPLQVLDVGFRVDGAPFREVRHLVRRHLHRDLLRHGGRDPALQVEHVLDLPVVAVGPQHLIRPRRDELHRDTHALADEERRTLEDRVHAQLARNLRQGLLDPLVLHGRRARDDPQRLQAREFRDQRLGHPVGEVLLGAVARNIVERKHRQRTDVVPPRRRGGRDALPGLLQSAKLVAQLEGRLEPGARFLLEAAPDDAIEVGREVGPDFRERLRRVAKDGRAHVRRRRPVEGSVPGDELIEHDPQREQVRPCIDRVATDLLRRHVRHRAHHLPGSRERRHPRRRLRRVQARLR